MSGASEPATPRRSAAAEVGRRADAGDVAVARQPELGSRSLGAARSSTPPRRRSRFTLRVDDRSGREVYTIALTRPDPDRAGEAHATTPRRASGWSSCSASPSAGRRPTQRLPLDQATCSSRPSPGRPRSESRCPAPTTSSSRRRSTSTRSPTARCRCAFHFNGTRLLPRRRRAAADRAGPLGHARRDFRMPVAVWQRDDRRLLPVPRLGPAAPRHARRAAARARPSAGLPTLDAAVAELLDEGGLDEQRARGAGRARCSTRATRSTRTRPGRPRTRRRRRSGSSTRRPTPSRSPAHLRPPAARVRARGAARTRELAATVRFLQAAASATRRSSAGSSWPGDARRAGRRRRRGPVRVRRRRASCAAGSRCAPSCSAPALARVRLCVHNATDVPGRRASTAARRCATACSPPTRCSRRRAGASSRRSSATGRRREAALPRASTPSRCSPRRRRRACSARRSCCPTTPRSRRRASATCSTTPRSRRRCCCTCTRSQRRRARADRRAGPGGARDDRARRRRRRREEIARACTAALDLQRPATPARPADGGRRRRPGEPEVEVDGVDLSARGDKVVLRPGHRRATSTTGCSTAARRRSSASTATTTDGVYLGVTVDDDPGQELLRETGRYLFFFADEVEVRADEPMTRAERRRSRSSSPGSATPGSATTASAARSSSASRRASCPPGVSVLDFGTGGLDLAYEVMRGYDALVLVDVSRQGGEPGTLYVMEPDPRRSRPIEDGEVINPHGMDPQTVLRFVKTVGGWPGKVVVVACEPADVEEMGLELSRAGQARRRPRRRPRRSRRSTSCSPTPPTSRADHARALARQRDRRHRRAPRRRAAR